MNQPTLFDSRHARRTDPATSHAARRGPSCEDLILDAFSKVASLTDDELVTMVRSKPASSVKTARSRLSRSGVLVNTGTTRDSVYGRPMIVWRHRDRAPVKRVDVRDGVL